MNLRNFLTRSSGWVFVILGGIGGLTCLALIIVTWVFAGKATRIVDEFFDGTAQITSRIEDGADRAATRLGELYSKVEGAQDRWNKTEGKTHPFEDAAWVEEIRIRIESIREWIALANAIGELITLVKETSQSFGILLQEEDSAIDKIVTSVYGGRARLEEARRSVEEIESALQGVRSDPEATADGNGNIRKRVENAFSRINTSLETLTAGINSFGLEIAAMDHALQELSSQIRQRINLGAWVVTLFFFWQAAAQLSLLVIGWKLRGRTARIGFSSLLRESELSEHHRENPNGCLPHSSDEVGSEESALTD
ncbi:MAG: hypothetical protein AAGC68_08940 [Verrucomicrobiota bacterium]